MLALASDAQCPCQGTPSTLCPLSHSAGDSSPKGTWQLAGCSVVERPAQGGRANLFALQASSGNKVLLIQAPSAEARQEWMQALSTNIALLEGAGSLSGGSVGEGAASPTEDAPSAALEPTPQAPPSLPPLSVFVSTWNMGEGALTQEALKAWIPLGRDVYAVSVQECLAPEALREAVASRLGEEYIPLDHGIGNANTSLGFHGFIYVAVFVHQRLVANGVALVSAATRREVRLGRNLVVTRAANKGAVAVILPLRVPDSSGQLTRLSSLVFVGCHLASDSKGASKLPARNADAAATLAALGVGFPTVVGEWGGQGSGGPGAATAPRSVSMGVLSPASEHSVLAAVSEVGEALAAEGGESGAGAEGDAAPARPPVTSNPLSEAGSDDGARSKRSSTLFFPLGRGDSVIRGRDGTRGTRGSGVSVASRTFTGPGTAAGGGHSTPTPPQGPTPRSGTLGGDALEARDRTSPVPFSRSSPGSEADGGLEDFGDDSASHSQGTSGGSEQSSGVDLRRALLNGYVFLAGDLNYRVKMSPEQAVLLVARAESKRLARKAELESSTAAASRVAPQDIDPERPWRRLLLMEELRAEMTWGRLFLGFEEAAVVFPPTYRRVRDGAGVLRRCRGDYADVRKVANGYSTHIAKGGGTLPGRAALPILAAGASSASQGAGSPPSLPDGAATGGAGSGRRGSRTAGRPAMTTPLPQHTSKKASAWLGGEVGLDSSLSTPERSRASSTASERGGEAQRHVPSGVGALMRVPSVRMGAFLTPSSAPVGAARASTDAASTAAEDMHLPLRPAVLSPPASEEAASTPRKHGTGKRFRMSMVGGSGAADTTLTGPKSRRRSARPQALAAVTAAAASSASSSGVDPAASPVGKRSRASMVPVAMGEGGTTAQAPSAPGQASRGAGDEGGEEEDGAAGSASITTRTPSYTDRILVRRPLSQQPPVVRAQVHPLWVMPAQGGEEAGASEAAGGTRPASQVTWGGMSSSAWSSLGTTLDTANPRSRHSSAALDGVAGGEEQGREAGGRFMLPPRPPSLPTLRWESYSMNDEVLGSDHVPVCAAFELDLQDPARGVPHLSTRVGGLLAQGGETAVELMAASSQLRVLTTKEAVRSALPTLNGLPLSPLQDATAVLGQQLAQPPQGKSSRKKAPAPPSRKPLAVAPKRPAAPPPAPASAPSTPASTASEGDAEQGDTSPDTQLSEQLDTYSSGSEGSVQSTSPEPPRTPWTGMSTRSSLAGQQRGNDWGVDGASLTLHSMLAASLADPEVLAMLQRLQGTVADVGEGAAGLPPPDPVGASQLDLALLPPAPTPPLSELFSSVMPDMPSVLAPLPKARRQPPPPPPLPAKARVRPPAGAAAGVSSPPPSSM